MIPSDIAFSAGLMLGVLIAILFMLAGRWFPMMPRSAHEEAMEEAQRQKAVLERLLANADERLDKLKAQMSHTIQERLAKERRAAVKRP